MRMLRFCEVRARVPWSRMHIDRLEKAGRFPRRVRTGPNSVNWIEDEIVEHLENLMAARSAQSVA